MEDQQHHVKRQSTFPLFSKYFGVKPQNIVDYVGSMKKQMQDFIDAFKKRIDIETNYAKSLTQVSKALDKYIKPGTELTTSYISSAFKVEHEQRSRQALELAEALKTQIEVMCSEMCKKEVAFHKKMEKDIKRFYKEAAGVQDNHRQALNRFESISREMEEMIITKNIMKYTSGIPQEKKVKLISKTMDSIRENKQYQKLYIQSVKNYNLFANAYNEEITSQLNEAETQIRDQVSLQCDCLRKLIVAQVSMFKNIEYDLLNISKQMEHLDHQKEVEMFVDEHKETSNHRIVAEEKLEENKKNTGSDIVSDPYSIQQKKVMGKSMLSNSLLHVDEEYFSWMLSNKKAKKLRDIVSGIWKELKEGKSISEIEKSQATPIEQNDKASQAVKAEENQQKPIQKAQTKPSTQSEPQLENKQDQKASPELKENKETQKKEQQIGESPAHNQSKELIQYIQSLKIQEPPNLISNGDKKQKTFTVGNVYESFMQIMKIISQLWNLDDLEAEFVDAKLQQLQKLMSEHHLYRFIAFIFLEQYRIQLEVMIKNTSCAKVCSRVIKTIVKESQKQNDTFIIRGILGLIFTYYWNDQKYKRLLYLSPEVFQCEIWKKHDFWQAAIFENTYQQMAMFAKQKGETPAQTVLRQKNIIFSQLASFCHYMVMLGITSKNVRLIVGRYCRLYQMTEEQNKDLSKMITNTTKQFKEISFQFSLKGNEKEKSVINEG